MEEHNGTTGTMAQETNGQSAADSMERKEERSRQDVAMIDIDVQDKLQDHKHTLLEEFQRTRANSSSDSDEQVEEGGECKKRKKKGLKDRIKEKISREVEQSGVHHNDTCIAMENEQVTNSEEKKGFLDKIIEKLPGHQHHKKPEEEEEEEEEEEGDADTKENKGLLDKIKEKLPGGHHKNDDEAKEKKEN